MRVYERPLAGGYLVSEGWGTCTDHASTRGLEASKLGLRNKVAPSSSGHTFGIIEHGSHDGADD